MSHDQVAELLAAYALDAVEPEEAVLVQAHLAECPRCTAELAEHQDVAARLGDMGGDAPRELWESIASQATIPGAVDRSSELRPPHRPRARDRRRRWVRAGVVAAVAAAAVAIVVLAVQVVRLDTQVANLTALTRAQGLTEASQAALLNPSARLVTLRSDRGSGEMVAKLVVVPFGHSFLVDSTLRALPKTRTYQLWAVTSGAPISLGLLGANPVVVPFVVNEPSHATTFAVTVEPASGSKGPTTTPVAEGS